MFTGIIEAMGRIVAVESPGGDRRVRVVTDGKYLRGLRVGDSVAVSGVCLTAVEAGLGGFSADVSVETLALTTAARWQAGTRVNLERAATPRTALGGHLVSGHVDGLARLLEIEPEARSRRLSFEAPPALARYIARKGSVALDGVSLTVNRVEGTRFGVNIVPHTWRQTTLGDLQPGADVNLEVDVVARYLERLLQAAADSGEEGHRHGR